MVDLIATKSMTYATRRLVPEQPFEAKSRDARILVAIGKARLADSKPEPIDQAGALRTQYEALIGKRPFMGWNADVLREKIAAHQVSD